MERHLPDLALIDRVRIQAEVLVPVVGALTRVVGRDAALDVVRDALRSGVRADARRLLADTGDSAAALMANFEGSGAGDSVTLDWKELTDDVARVDATRCAFAEFFSALREEDLGSVLVCEGDAWFAEELGDVVFERTGTLMLGADRCDFCYRRASGEGTT
jgi:hypothetical protein